jgi:alkanesulfonate monooxygenase SsuD/methylene tetrahydromethanopterin reductase-like flavin-dependent oxidoreductase (luciferase family)
VLGVGGGTERTAEFSAFGEETGVSERAAMLDEGLEVIDAVWSGAPVHHKGAHYQVDGITFHPVPVQRPLPVWVAATWPHGRPLRRAARWQGVVPARLPGPGAVAEIIRVIGPDKDIVIQADERPASDWARAGATWWLRGLRGDAVIRDVEALIDAGPPAV